LAQASCLQCFDMLKGWQIELITFLVVLALIYCCFACLLRRWLTRILEANLGVRIEIQNFRYLFHECAVAIYGLKVKNPEGSGYDSDHAILLQQIFVDISFCKSLGSCFRTVYIRELTLLGFDITWEKTTFGSSNLRDILEYVQARKNAEDEDEKEITQEPNSCHAGANKVRESMRSLVAKSPGDEKKESETLIAVEEKPKKKKREVRLKKVVLKEIGATMVITGSEGTTAAITLEEIEYENFSEETDCKHLHTTLAVLGGVMLKALGKGLITKGCNFNPLNKVRGRRCCYQ